jgi:ketosteroid isomerase-like protein
MKAEVRAGAQPTHRRERDTARTVSQENQEVMRSMYAAFSRIAEGGDVAAYVTGHYDPDCEYQPVEEIDPIHDHDALVRWNERWFEAWEQFGADVDEIIEANDVMVVAITVHGRGGESGMEISQRVFHVSEVRNGRIVRMREYLERDQALEAAGLRE